LRRSKDDRVAAGLCGGLGRYFGVDPVIFRVLVAVLVLFGGSGIVVYLIGWLALPDEDAVNAPIDRVVANLRHRSTPIIVLMAIGALIAWGLLFSWWAPFSIFPAVIALIAVVVLIGRRDRHTTDATGDVPTGAVKPSTELPLDPASVQIRSWYEEARDRSRERRRRSAPVRWTTLGLLVASIIGLVIADSITGIPFGTYFWVLGGLSLSGLLIGLVSRRTPWTIAILLVPALIGITSFGTSNARAHDGLGERKWMPTSSADVRPTYRFGFGQATLDLTHVSTPPDRSSVKIVQGAGQLRLLIPRDLPVRINADVHQGEIQENGDHRDEGWNVTASYASPSAVSARSVLTIDVELTAGQLDIRYL
jgi:phage shock protein PspC (stress-responsive transcriptional regulator)